MIALENVSVSYPIYQSSSRSIRRAILRTAVGGWVGNAPDGKSVEVQALRNVFLEINAGDRLALIGHNGAGKSTFLRVLAGVYAPSAGELVKQGRAMSLFDIHLGFDEEATGYENIMMRGLLLGLTRVEINDRTERIAEFSGLGSFLELPVRTYSSGMTLRLLFSIATSIDADIVLIDEWLAAGDRAFVAKADAKLREVIGRSKIMVLASHHAALLRSLCNRGIVLDCGQITFDGPVDEALSFYAAKQAA